ncbi:MAG: ABATE domain-containing protein [Chloroflexota bacterium]
MIEGILEEREYSRIGGWIALDFTNTKSGSAEAPTPDYFQSYRDLTTWARQMELITEEEESTLNRQAEIKPAEADNVLQRARSLRLTIYRIFSAVSIEEQPNTDAVEGLNRVLREAMSHASIKKLAGGSGGLEWGWVDFPGELDSILWPVARSAADLLVNGEKLERVRTCAGDTCGWLFLDTSKNHSRRWCDMRDCGNTAKARRHYQRKAKAVS